MSTQRMSFSAVSPSGDLSTSGNNYSNIFGSPPSAKESHLDFPRIKILTLGNANVGKSCFVKRYCEDRFVMKYIPTIGIDYGVKTASIRPEELAKYNVIEAKHRSSNSTRDQGLKKGTMGGRGLSIHPPTAVRINFWDVAGGREAFEIRNEFYGSAQGLMLMYDVRDIDSFKALDSWWEEASQYIPLAYGDTPSIGLTSSTTANTPAGKVVGDCGTTPPVVIVCGNKVDQEPSNGAPFRKRLVSPEEGKAWAEAHHCAGFYETSCASSDMVMIPMEALIHQVVSRFFS